MGKKFLAIVLWLFLLSEAVFGTMTNVTFTWDLNDPAEEVEYYTLYAGDIPGGPYSAELDAEAPPATIGIDITPGSCKYFVLTARQGDLESGPSNEVSKCLDPLPVSPDLDGDGDVDGSDLAIFIATNPPGLTLEDFAGVFGGPIDPPVPPVVEEPPVPQDPPAVITPEPVVTTPEPEPTGDDTAVTPPVTPESTKKKKKNNRNNGPCFIGLLQ